MAGSGIMEGIMEHRRMNIPLEISTSRLLLRRWIRSDREPFAALNADPQVMKFFLTALTREESDAFIDRIEAHFERNHFGLWAVEIPKVASFIGFVGLSVPKFEAHFTPCVEIGWRLASPFWNKGYATEGAKAVLNFGFQKVGLKEIVSFTTVKNDPSRRVMEKIGMTHDSSGDFDHPSILPGHPFRRHVLYRIKPESS